MNLQNMYYKVMIVCAIIMTLVFTFKGFTQPVLNDHELVAEVHVPKECWSAKIHKCSSAKLTTSILSGHVHDKVQSTIIYKLSGDIGKVGAQSWIKANKLVWLGWETVTSLNFDFDHELYGAAHLTYGNGAFTFLPYASMHMKSETVGSVGFVTYITKNMKFGWEYRYQKAEGMNEMVVMAGMRLDDAVFEKIYDVIEKMLPESKDEQEPNYDTTNNIAVIQ